jgi:hypothetical protein
LSRALARVSSGARLFFYDFMVQPIGGPPILPPRALQAFSSRWLEAGAPELREMPISASVLESRFAQGAVCLGVFMQEHFVGYVWFTFGAYNEDEVRCRYLITPEQHSVFDFDLYIFPAYRLGRAFVALWQHAMTMLADRGIKYSFSRVTRFNTASHRAHSHLGWRRVASAVFLRLWTLELMIASIRPFVHASVGSRPSLTLRADALNDDAGSRRARRAHGAESPEGSQ